MTNSPLLVEPVDAVPSAHSGVEQPRPAKTKQPRTVRIQVTRHATSDHEFTSEEDEVLAAIEEFKRKSGRKFPSYTEILRLLKALGYAKQTAEAPEPECV